MSLAEARQKAFDFRKLARAGGDPRALRPGVPTFAEAIEKVIAIHRASWRSGGGSEAQWRSSLRDYAMPRLGRKYVDEITTADVLGCLVPIWSAKSETARRVRQRIGAVMQWAVAKGYREDNPAGDAIAAALPKNGGKRNHFRAIPHHEVAAALATVGSSGAWPGTKLAFEFLVLTAARSGEIRKARWEEIDFEAATWTVPAEYEGRTEAPGSAVPAGARGAEEVARTGQRDRAGVPFPDGPNAVAGDPHEAAPREWRPGGPAWVQNVVPDMVRGRRG